MASYEDLLSDVVIFLKETLSAEVLSPNANRQRIALLLKLTSMNNNCNNGNPAFTYMDMSGNGNQKGVNTDLTECYEELESNSEWSGCSSNFSRNYTNTSLYSHHPNNNNNNNNIGQRHSSSSRSNGSHRSQKEDPPYENTYIGIDSNSDSSTKTNSQRLSTNSDNSMSAASSRSGGEMGERSISTLSLSTVRNAAIKCGQLTRKDKIIFVEHTKRCWVALLGTTFYVYNNEKDSKPAIVVNVDDYRARPINPITNKKDFGFEIVCPGKKTYQFFANSKSEMESWVSFINQSMPLPCISTVNSSTVNHTNNNNQWNSNNISCNDNSLTIPIINNGIIISNGGIINRHPNNSSDNGRDDYLHHVVSQGGVRENSLRRETLERELPSIPAASKNHNNNNDCATIVYEHYDKPNPIIRPVGLQQNLIKLDRSVTDGHTRPLHQDSETFYHSIAESEPDVEAFSRYDYPNRKFQLSESYYVNANAPNPEANDNLYYNTLPTGNCTNFQNGIKLCEKNMENHTPIIAEEEVIYDGVAEDEKENCENNHPGSIGRIQQIIQQIEEISHKNSSLNNKKSSPLSKRNSKIIINAPITVINDEIYELVNTPTLINGKV